MSRFYIVRNKSEEGAYCVVEANTRAAALQRAAAHYCTVEIASPRDVLDAMKWERDVIEMEKGEQQELPLESPLPEGNQVEEPA